MDGWQQQDEIGYELVDGTRMRIYRPVRDDGRRGRWMVETDRGGVQTLDAFAADRADVARRLRRVAIAAAAGAAWRATRVALVAWARSLGASLAQGNAPGRIA